MKVPDMNRLPGLKMVAVAAALLALWAGPGVSAEPSGPSPGELGRVAGDTIFVNLAQVTTAALEHNEMLAAASAMTEAAEAEALAAWRGFLPRIQVGEFFVRSDDPLTNFAFKLDQRRVTANDFSPDLLRQPGANGMYTTRLQVQQPIFNGGQGIAGKQAADAAARAAAFDHRRAEETVVFQTSQAYHGLALARAYERVVLAAVQSAEGHLRQARTLVEAEMATPADLLQATVHLSNLKQRLIEVRNLRVIAGENLKLLTALETDLTLAPATELTHPDGGETSAPPDLTTLLLRADLQAGGQRSHAAGKMVAVARGNLLPHLNLSAERNHFGEGLFPDEARSWTFGVHATWDIFAGLENVGRLRQARAERRAAGYLHDFRTRQARVEATEAWLSVIAAREKVAVATEAVDAAREGLRIVENQYREGLASMVDLLDTQAAATGAEGNLVQALHDYHVGLAQLRYAGGDGPNGQE